MAGKSDRRILVVDDNEASRFELRSHLRQLGYLDVATCAGAGALAKLRELGDCGLVLSEWEMNGTDGVTLLREIRQDPALRPLRFAMVTKNINPGAVAIAKQAGANGYIIKPYTLATLKARLETLLAEATGAAAPKSPT